MELFVLDKPETVWGDYGDVLLHGIVERDEDTGILYIERTGPFVPYISFPGLSEIVVTDSLRHLLEASGLTGFSFRRVIKHRIVALDWEQWNQDVDEPPVYPESGEPEDYIVAGTHSQDTADQMPALWELVIEPSVHAASVQIAPTQWQVVVQANSWTGTDVVRASEVLYTFVSPRAKRWFEQHVSTFVSFNSIQFQP